MSEREDKGERPIKVPGQESVTTPLPKRFYSEVAVRTEPDGNFGVLLDGRAVRTPAKLPLTVPTRALAEAIAAEWSAQTENIDPATMPLSKLAITAIDGVAQHVSEVAEDIVRYAGSDLLCYRAEGPQALAELQAKVWDPIVHWFEAETGSRFLFAEGIMPVTQTPEALEGVARLVAPFDSFALAGLHVMTTLTGSAALALATARGRLSADEAWAAAHLDEDWQIARWGVDVEAKERRERRWADMQAAARFLELIRQ